MALVLAIVAVEGGTGKGICLRNEGVGFLNRPGGAGGGEDYCLRTVPVEVVIRQGVGFFILLIISGLPLVTIVFNYMKEGIFVCWQIAKSASLSPTRTKHKEPHCRPIPHITQHKRQS